MKLNRLIQVSALLAVLFAFIACDEDYSNIGGEIINNPTDVKLSEFEVNAYSQKINSIQTNNLTSLFLGTYNDPVYGESNASIVTQAALSAEDPSFGDNVKLDSVVLTLPYFYHETDASTTEQPEYALDSLFGSGSFKLSVYETSYFLNDLDPDAGFEQSQKYYSDQQAIVEQNVLGEPLYTDDNFIPSPRGYTNYEVNSDGENDTIAKTPAMRLKLPPDFFEEKILNKEGDQVLLNNENFKNYFRSLYIKAEPNGSGNSEILLNFNSSDAKITLYYRYDQETTNTDGDTETTTERDSFDLSLSGSNRFNTYTGEFPEDILQNIQEQDSLGAEKLYIKGQEGSLGIIRLFPDQTVLEDLRQNHLLINEADLIFYVDQDAMAASEEPVRLFLFDLDNNNVLLDYVNDPVSTDDPQTSKTTFSSLLEKGEDDRGIYYKIRITQHISNIINNEADNVRLGLVVTGNINTTGNSAVKGIENVETVPKSELYTPFGTVLYGDEAADDEKRLKLRIYYTDYN